MKFIQIKSCHWIGPDSKCEVVNSWEFRNWFASCVCRYDYGMNMWGAENIEQSIRHNLFQACWATLIIGQKCWHGQCELPNSGLGIIVAYGYSVYLTWHCHCLLFSRVFKVEKNNASGARVQVDLFFWGVTWTQRNEKSPTLFRECLAARVWLCGGEIYVARDSRVVAWHKLEREIGPKDLPYPKPWKKPSIWEAYRNWCPPNSGFSN